MLFFWCYIFRVKQTLVFILINKWFFLVFINSWFLWKKKSLVIIIFEMILNICLILKSSVLVYLEFNIIFWNMRINQFTIMLFESCKESPKVTVVPYIPTYPPYDWISDVFYTVLSPPSVSPRTSTPISRNEGATPCLLTPSEVHRLFIDVSLVKDEQLL